MTWNTLVQHLLDFFRNIQDFGDWLFSPINFNIEHPDNEVANFFFGWLIDLINQIEIDIIPIEIFGIGLFVGIVLIGIFKLIF